MHIAIIKLNYGLNSRIWFQKWRENRVDSDSDYYVDKESAPTFDRNKEFVKL